MGRTRVAFAFWMMIVLSTSGHSQSWSGIVDPTRAADWTQAGISGGIPTRTTICATLNPGATSAEINSAIATCPSGQVVFLSAGTYAIASGINFQGHSNITLRGAGPGETILQFTGGDTCNGNGGDICVTDSAGYYDGSPQVQPGGSNAHNWTSGYARGTTQIGLDSVSGLSIGQIIILDQADDTSDTGGVFVCDLNPSCQSGGGGNSDGRTISGVDYSQQQLVKVMAINGDVITISPGLYMNNWRASQNPKMWWTPQITQAGIEDMTVDHSASTRVKSGILFYDCNECWVQNVKSIDANRNHIWLYQSSHTVVHNSYFYGTQNGASQSYGVETLITSDDLIENNIFDTVTNPIMFGDGEGVVSGYNFAINDYYYVPAWMMGIFSSHNAGNAMNLFEGNQVVSLFCDDTWGSSNLVTYFRNQLMGWQSGKTLNTQPVTLQSFCRAFNVIGNVLGTPSYHNKYESSPQTSSTNCDTSIYQLGFSGTECSNTGAPPNDALVRATLMRWGNYDTVNAATQWNPSEIPTSGFPYINGNPVPQNENLPMSFYLGSVPTWWGNSIPWPPIGPDVVGGTGPGGHAYPNPAQSCYSNGTFTNGILNFDANKCYGGTNAPQAPTGLSAVVQ
jgi:hypothetical protein